MAEQDWSGAVTTAAAYTAPDSDTKTSNDVQLMNEFLVATIERDRVYSVDVANHHVGPDGQAVNETKPVYFRVNDLMHGHSRPHVMPTVEATNDLIMRAPLALNVQFLETHDAVEQDVSGPIVFPPADEEWVLPSRIAGCKSLTSKLDIWKDVPSEADEGCVVLSDKKRALPKYHPLDNRCPTVVVVMHLIRAGWTMVKALVDHTTVDVGNCDSRQSVRMKPYYQACLSIQKCLPLTSHMPSQEVCRYYECLMRGIRAEPGQADRNYLFLLNESRKKRLLLPLPPLEDEPGNGDEVILAVEEEATG